MGQLVKLNPENAKVIREMNPAMTSYNVEMTEVTGGTFWKAYTPGQVAGTEEVPPPDFSKGGNPLAAMHQWYDPIDTTNPSQAEKIFALSKEYGVPIEAVEFTNEPNMMEGTGFPKGYTPADFRRDQDLFHKWVRENYPEVIIVGPSTVDASALRGDDEDSSGGAGIADVLTSCTTGDLLDGCTEKLDVFSYHYYNGVSERMRAMCPDMYTPASEATSEPYINMAGMCARCFAPYRDKYVPGGEMWVTESGDAGAGGHTWASTYLEVVRELNEFGDFATATNGVIFHNTLASSDYGYLQHGTFAPRPSYFAVLLWNQLMGTTVYDSGEANREGAHVYAHSRKDGKEGIAYLVINNSTTDVTTVELAENAEIYRLNGTTGMRSATMSLNGKELVLGENDELPVMNGENIESGSLEVAPRECIFIVM